MARGLMRASSHLALLTFMLLAHDAKADDLASGMAEPSPEPLDDDDLSDWDHFEISMGFLGGARSYDKANFGRTGGDDLPGAASLTAPFRAAPFDEVYVAGLRYDLRLVVSYVRMTAGVDIPFPIYRTDQTLGTYDVGGVARTVSVRNLRPYDLRFGLGAEYPIGPVAPFFDLLGTVHWTNATLDIDGTKQDYQAVGFGLSGRLGARLHVRRWFFASMAGELGFVGDVRWGAEVAVGFAVM